MAAQGQLDVLLSSLVAAGRPDEALPDDPHIQALMYGPPRAAIGA